MAEHQQEGAGLSQHQVGRNYISTGSRRMLMLGKCISNGRKVQSLQSQEGEKCFHNSKHSLQGSAGLQLMQQQ